MRMLVARHVPAIELLPEPFPKVALERREIGRQPRGEVEMPVIHGADLDP